MEKMNVSSDNSRMSYTEYSESEYSDSAAESSGSESESTDSKSYSSQSTDSSNDDMPLVSLAKQKKRHDAGRDHNQSGSSGSDSSIAFRSKPKNRIISDDEDTDDPNLNVSYDKSSVSNKSTQNISKSVNSSIRNSNGNFIESNNSHLHHVKLGKQKELIIAEANEKHNDITSNTSANKSCASSTSNLSSFVDDNLSSNASANKSSASRASNVNPSKSLGSFVDENLFGDASQNSTEPEIHNSRKLESSSNISFNKSFSKYRTKKDSMSSDEKEHGNNNSSKNDYPTDYTKKKIKKKRSSIRRSKRYSKAVLLEESDDDKFEAEFQRNIYSPRTRMSITGKCITSDLSESDYEKSVHSTAIDEMGPIVIPDSDDENDDSTTDQFLDFKPLNVTSLKNPLEASSPLPKSKLQPKITNLAEVYVSQEFYDKQVMKLNEMENELHKSVLLRGAFQVKLPDDGRRLSGRIDRLKLDIEQLQQYIATLQIQTDFSQNEIKPKPKTFTNVIELSWDALDAATNEVKPKYTGTVGLKNFNTQKFMTLDTLKEIHESLTTCPKPETLADDPDGLKIDLMPHQKHALAWLEWRETQRPRGGILADDMGLGKTLTIIAHVLAANYRKENCSNEESDEEKNPHDGWTAKGRKDLYDGGTLVVCPASLIGQWESEIKNRLRRNILNYIVHHGNKRDVKARHLAKADIVITTYHLVSRECLGNNRGPLANVKWERVVLDEAHVIRNHKSRMSESVSALNRRYNWILTGTPIQNKEMDMFALLRFLKCRPFDDLGQFKKWIDNKNPGGQLRMNTILKAILLRRTKAELIETGGLVDMPSKTVQIVEVTLEKDEMNVYQKIMLYSQTLFAQYLHQRAEKDDGRTFDYKKPKANSAIDKAHKMMVQLYSGMRDVKSHEILVLLLRLRQICCHPGLITAMLEDEDKSTVFDDSTSDHDSINIDLLEQINKLNVNDDDKPASFDLPDGDRISKASQRVLCKSNPVYELTRPSSKFQKVLEILKKHILPKNENAVIVSQWTHVLEVIGKMLHRERISYSSLTGTVQVKHRGAIVDNFNQKSSTSKILLLSLTAGGVGLNLVGGNHLLLVDLHWNPQLEAQAQDRVYRVGQTKPVTIYKFICTNTIEQRIQQLQEKKLQIADGVLTGSGTKGSKLSVDDLKSLFDI